MLVVLSRKSCCERKRQTHWSDGLSMYEFTFEYNNASHGQFSKVPFSFGIFALVISFLISQRKPNRGHVD